MRTTPVVHAPGSHASSQNSGGQNHSNLNLNNGSHFNVQPVVSSVHHGGNDYGLNFSNQNQSHYISLPSSSSYALHNVQFPPTAGVIPVDPALIRAPQKSPKKSRKRLAAEDSTLKQHIEAYERAQGIAPGAVELENRDLEGKSPEVREKRTKKFRSLFCTPPPPTFSSAFELPRHQRKDDGQDLDPEVVEFKSSQKPFNPDGNGQAVGDETMKKEEAVQLDVRVTEDSAAGVELQRELLQEKVADVENVEEKMDQDEQAAAGTARDAFDELTKYEIPDVTPKKKRNRAKSQATTSRERRAKGQTQRGTKQIKEDTNEEKVTPVRRSTQRVERRAVLSPYPVTSITQPARPSSLRPRSAKQRQAAEAVQEDEDVLAPIFVPAGADSTSKDSNVAAHSLPPTTDFEVELSQRAIPQRDASVKVVDFHDSNVRQGNRGVWVDDDGVVNIDDIDNVRGPQEAPLPNEPDFRGLNFRDNELRNAPNLTRHSWGSDQMISAFMAGFIPHHLNHFDRIAFLDTFWLENQNHNILEYLRIFPHQPEMIIAYINVGAKRKINGKWIGGNHWTLLAINVLRDQALYFDPMMTALHTQMTEEELQKCNAIIRALAAAAVINEETQLTRAPMHTFNQQNDGSSCAYHVMIIAEDIARYGHSVRHMRLDIAEERDRINRILFRLWVTNEERFQRGEWSAGLPTWPDELNRTGLLSSSIQFTQKPILPPNNTLIKKVAAKPIPKKVPQLPTRKSQRIAAQPPKKIDVQKKINSLNQLHRPLGRNSSEIFPPADYQGKMNKRCPHECCKAYLFPNEDSNKCCAHGTVQPMQHPPMPHRMAHLMEIKEFWKYINPLNSLYSMVSTSAQIKRDDGVFKLQGEVQHNIGDLVSVNGEPAQFAQVYSLHADTAIQNRFIDFKKLGYKGREADCSEVINLIEYMLREHHPLAKELQTMKDQLENYAEQCRQNGIEVKKLYMIWEDPQRRGARGAHPGTLNAPAANDQHFSIFNAAESDGQPPKTNGLWYGYMKDGSNRVQTVPAYSGRVDCAAYPLIFIFGQEGWTQHIRKLNHLDDIEEEDEDEAEKQKAAVDSDNDDDTADTSVAAQPDGKEFEEDILDADSDEDITERKRKNVSFLQHKISQMYDRTTEQKNIYNPVTSMRELFQKYLTNSWISVDQRRTTYLQKVADDNPWRYGNNKQLREYIEREMEKDPLLRGKQLGKIRLMPRTYRSGTRYMHHKFKNGIAINQKCGKDDLFVTFTGNPYWPEIQENLRPGETWIDRPDLVCRVFNLKAKEFLNDIVGKGRGVLGKVKAFKIALEHQKRGMPHLHCLLTMENGYKFKTPEQIDDTICAEILEEPDPMDPYFAEKNRYREYVLKYMIHDPSRCVVCCGKGKRNGLCGKGFPKQNCQNTELKTDGYAKIRRRADGRTVKIRKNSRKVVEVNNQWVVPHNRYLLLKYNCHINVEHCGGVKALKYLHKYLHKGHDKAFISVRERVKLGQPTVPGEVQRDANGNEIEVFDYDEIHQFRCLRIIGAAEAMERMLGMFITKQSHVVTELPVHLPDEHSTCFKAEDTAKKILKKTKYDPDSEFQKAVSMLTAFFKLVAEEKDDEEIDHLDETRAENLFYFQVVEHYWYSLRSKKWIRRIREKTNTIGRLQSVYPSNVELFCLRELLKITQGPTCFDDLKKWDGQTYTTFRQAAVVRGLYIDDEICHRIMKEVVTYAMPRKCRQTYALLLLYNQPENPRRLWDAFKEHFLDTGTKLSKAEKERRALAHVAAILCNHKKIMQDYGMPKVSDDDIVNALYDTFSNFKTDGNERYASLNFLQKSFTDTVLHSFDNIRDPSRDRLFFLQADGGTGKTYVFNTLIRILREHRYKILVCASTGIAAILLDGGKTAHSAFRIPLDVLEPARIEATHPLAKIIREADCIIMDEAPMQHKSVLERIEALIQQLCGTPLHFNKFGNKTVILGGDFKQLLPVMKHELPLAAYDASILCSETFTSQFKMHTLTENVRAKHDPEYAQFLLEVGNGLNYSSFGPDKIQLPPDIVLYKEKETIDFVYPDEIFTYGWDAYVNYVKDVALLTPLNEKVRDLNDDVSAKLPAHDEKAADLNDLLNSKLGGKSMTYKSVDTLPKASYPGDEIVRQQYDSEDLNGFEHPTIPPHALTLKVGTVVMLSRNLDTESGLCNGTRMVVTRLHDSHIECQVITGKAENDHVSIFPLPNTYDEPQDDWPAFSRFQMPLRPAFAMTINKGQGQTLVKVGVILEHQCFAHGQLYVALSRVRKREDIRVFIGPDDIGIDESGGRHAHATNIVFQQVLKQVKHLTVTPPTPPQQDPQSSSPQQEYVSPSQQELADVQAVLSQILRQVCTTNEQQLSSSQQQSADVQAVLSQILRQVCTTTNEQQLSSSQQEQADVQAVLSQILHQVCTTNEQQPQQQYQDQPLQNTTSQQQQPLPKPPIRPYDMSWEEYSQLLNPSPPLSPLPSQFEVFIPAPSSPLPPDDDASLLQQSTITQKQQQQPQQQQMPPQQQLPHLLQQQPQNHPSAPFSPLPSQLDVVVPAPFSALPSHFSPALAQLQQHISQSAIVVAVQRLARELSLESIDRRLTALTEKMSTTGLTQRDSFHLRVLFDEISRRHGSNESSSDHQPQILQNIHDQQSPVQSTSSHPQQHQQQQQIPSPQQSALEQANALIADIEQRQQQSITAEEQAQLLQQVHSLLPKLKAEWEQFRNDSQHPQQHQPSPSQQLQQQRVQQHQQQMSPTQQHPPQ